MTENTAAMPPPAQPRARKGFWASLFDLDFRDNVTPAVLSVLYAFGLILTCLGAAAGVISGLVVLAQGHTVGLVVLLLTPVLAFLAVLAWRVQLELIAVAFRILDAVRDLR